MNIRNFIKNQILTPVLEDQITLLPVNGAAINSYSQLGEDLVIDALLQKDKGFYIDIGANDPEKFSNTKRFYDKGWNGIVIEPNPALAKKLIDARPRDTVFNIGIGTEYGMFPFYEVSGNTLSSFDRGDAERGCKKYNEHIMREIPILVQPLSDLSLPDHIDFMSIDTEGNELDILRSHDWTNPPTVIVIEINNHTNLIYTYLTTRGYDLVYKNHLNGIFYRKPIPRSHNEPTEENHTHDWRGM
jgi:FkbM family methyltransferase